MRQKISYNSDDYGGSAAFWIILIIIICCCFWWTPSGSWGWGGGWSWVWILIFFLFFWWILALCFVPLDVYADDDEVRIRRPFKTRRIRMNEIQSAEPYQVSRNAKGKAFKSVPIRTFGKWGHYHDDNIGDYFAYYGKPDQTVLITLKDGRKYVVGGSDAKAMADYINSKVNS